MEELQVVGDGKFERIITGLIGSGISIVVTSIIMILIKHHKRSLIKQEMEISDHNEMIYKLSFVTLTLFLFTPMSSIFIRTGYNDHIMSHQRCYVGYIIFYLSYFVGQWCLSTLFLYRLYVAFPQSKCMKILNCLIAALFGILSLTMIMWMFLSPKRFVNRILINSIMRYCGNAKFGFIGNSKVHPIYIAYTSQTMYNVYLLTVFVCKLCKLKRQIPRNDLKDTRIKHIILKIFILVSISVFCTLTFMVTNIVRIEWTVAISYPLIIDAICSYLLFFVNNDKEMSEVNKSSDQITTNDPIQEKDTNDMDDTFKFGHLDGEQMGIQCGVSNGNTNNVKTQRNIVPTVLSQHVVLEELTALCPLSESSI